jgi:hypothetical protein
VFGYVFGKPTDDRENAVFDILMLVLLGVAFGGAAAYVWACADLTRLPNAGGNKAP